MTKSYKVSFSTKSKEDLRSIFDNVKEASESKDVAHNVRKTLLLSAKNLKTFPEKYQLDEYYEDLKVHRYFVWNYRIVFEIIELEVVILRIFGTHQLPIFFKK